MKDNRRGTGKHRPLYMETFRTLYKMYKIYDDSYFNKYEIVRVGKLVWDLEIKVGIWDIPLLENN